MLGRLCLEEHEENVTAMLGRNTPFILVLEDLHWSDASTIDLLAYLGERTAPARRLVVPRCATSSPASVR
jgi:predicted ATPase